MRREEGNGPNFLLNELEAAKDRAWELLRDLARQIEPGTKESLARELYFSLCKSAGIEKQWHPPQIRFGVNTRLPFGAKAEDRELKEDDIYFLDLGPIINGYEGDVGQTFAVGRNLTSQKSPQQKIVEANRVVFDQVKNHWRDTGTTGPELYAYAEATAKNLGYQLSLQGASGHRIGDFPHAIHFRGKLKEANFVPQPNRWILEIHLLDPSGEFGAFHEDLL